MHGSVSAGLVAAVWRGGCTQPQMDKRHVRLLVDSVVAALSTSPSPAAAAPTGGVEVHSQPPAPRAPSTAAAGVTVPEVGHVAELAHRAVDAAVAAVPASLDFVLGYFAALEAHDYAVLGDASFRVRALADLHNRVHTWQSRQTGQSMDRKRDGVGGEGREGGRDYG